MTLPYFVIDLKYNRNAMIYSKLNNAIQNINDLPSKEFEFIKKCFIVFHDNIDDYILNTN